MLFKLTIVILLLFIIVSLCVSFYFLVKDKDTSKRVVNVLSIRIGLCIAIIILLFIGVKYGFISPHSFVEVVYLDSVYLEMRQYQ